MRFAPAMLAIALAGHAHAGEPRRFGTPRVLLGQAEGVQVSRDGKTAVAMPHGGPRVEVHDLVRVTLLYATDAFRVTLSPDGRWLATQDRSDATTITVHDVANRKVLRSLSSPEGPLSGACFSPDGTHVAGTVNARTKTPKLLVFTVASGEVVDTIPGARALAFTGDGKALVHLVAPFSDFFMTVSIRELKGAELARFSTIHADPHVSPDGKLVAFERQVHDLTGKFVFTLDPVSVAAGFTDAHELFAWDPNGVLQVHEAATGKVVRALPDTREWSRVLVPASGKLVGIAPGWGAVTLLDPQTAAPVTTSSGHAGPVRRVRFSPDGKTLATSDGESAIVWDVATAKEVRRSAAADLAFSPDGKHLALRDATGLRITDLATGALVRALELPDDAPFALMGDAIVLGGEHLAWLTTTGELVRRATTGAHFLAAANDRVAAADASSLYLADKERETPVGRWDPEERGPLLGIGLSADARWLLAHGLGLPGASNVRVWNTTTREEVLLAGRGPAAITPDGLVAYLEEKGDADSGTARTPELRRMAAPATVVFVDPATRKRAGALPEGSPPTALAVSPDGKSLAVGRADGTVLVFDVPR